MKCYICTNTKTECEFFVKLNSKYLDEDMHICGDCIDKMYEAKTNTHKDGYDGTIPSTKDIVEYLDNYLISQPEAKKTLAVSIRNHYKRLSLSSKDSELIDKSNVMIMGESGTGKTALVKKVAEFINVPVVVIDTSVITTDGYIGDSVENAVVSLYNKSNKDVSVAETGMIFFDEIDKKRKSPDSDKMKDVSGESVQTSMLKLIEGKQVKVDKDTFINTDNILFICGGAFVDLRGIIERRMKKKKIGFVQNENKNENISMEDIYKNVTTEDLIDYGLIPELVGRFPVITYTKTLSKEDIKRVITEPKDSIIKQFQKLFKVDGISLSFDQKAIDYIADRVVENKTGVRGVRKVIEEVLEDIQYNIEDYKEANVSRITLTKNKNENYLKPKFRYVKSQEQ